MARDLAYLLPLLLLACDPGTASTPDTDGDDGSSSSAETSEDPSPADDDDTSGDTSGNADTSGGPDDPDPTGDDPTGKNPTGDDDTDGGGTDGDDTDGSGTDTDDGDDTDGDDTDGGDTDGDDTATSGEPPSPVCGDGVIEGDEACDDGDDNGSYDHCAADCSGAGPYCGDGNTDAGVEQCDDGDAINGNGCNTDCVDSGSTLWEATKTTVGPTSFDRGVGVAAGPGDTIRIAQRSMPDSHERVIITDFDLDGVELDERNHTSPDPGVVRVQFRDLSSSGGYLIAQSAIAPTANPDDLYAYGDDHLVDWTAPIQRGADASRRPSGGAIRIEGNALAGTTQWIVLDATGTETYESPANADVVHGTAVPLGDASIAVAGALNVGEYVPTLSRFSVDGGSEFHLEYDAPDVISVDRWIQASLASNDSDDIAAACTSSVHEDNELLISYFNADGTLAWDVLYDHPGDDSVHVEDLAIDSTNNVVVVGRLRTGVVPNAHDDAFVAKFDSTGAHLWTRTYSGDVEFGNERANGVAILDDDSVVVVGTREDIENAHDAWLARLAP